MTAPVYKKTRTPVVETVPARHELLAPPVEPVRHVESPPQSAPSQLDRIEALLKKVATRLQIP